MLSARRRGRRGRENRDRRDNGDALGADPEEDGLGRRPTNTLRCRCDRLVDRPARQLRDWTKAHIAAYE